MYTLKINIERIYNVQIIINWIQKDRLNQYKLGNGNKIE
jgi:hypothetical protein